MTYHVTPYVTSYLSIYIEYLPLLVGQLVFD